VRFSRKRHDESAPNFFQDLGERTCSLQPALKNTAPPLSINLLKQKSQTQLTKRRLCGSGISEGGEQFEIPHNRN